MNRSEAALLSRWINVLAAVVFFYSCGCMVLVDVVSQGCLVLGACLAIFCGSDGESGKARLLRDCE